MSNPLKSLNEFANQWAGVLGLLTPVIGFIGVCAASYFVLWMSANYVPKVEFTDYMSIQERQGEIITEKLQVIISQQNIFVEQVRNQGNQISRIDDRLTYLERKKD